MKINLFKFIPLNFPPVDTGRLEEWFKQEKIDNPEAIPYDTYTIASDGPTGGSEVNRPLAIHIYHMVRSLSVSYDWLKNQR